MSTPRPFDRSSHRAIAPLLALALLASSLAVAPGTARAADPSLGGAVTLPDGRVLPEMPAEQLAPSAQAEMLTQHGGLDATAGGAVADVDGGLTAEAAPEPLVAAEGGVAGPAGPLPNGLRREVLGFLPYWKLDTTTRSKLRLDLVSTIAYFSVGVQSNGYLLRGTSTSPAIGWSGWTSSAVTELISSAHQRGVRVVPTITMMAWDGDYSGMSTVLTNSVYRSRLVGEVVGMVRDRRADGVNVDFEPVPSSLRDSFTAFVRQLKQALVDARVGSFVTVDTMAGAASWATGYDVVGLSQSGAADALMVMSYDYSWSGSARAGGVAPIDSPYIFSVTDALRDHLSLVAPGKLIWGVPYYGRAWNTTTTELNSTVRSPASSTAFSYYGSDADGPFGAKVDAARYGRKWDAVGKVPWFVFWDSKSSGYRQAYYDDAVSLGVKYDLVNRNALAGIGIWSLGMDTGTNDLWNVIYDRFVKLTVRVAGSDRYATAAAISASRFAPGVSVAYVATGANFPDALAAGPVAGVQRAPILLTAATALPSSTATELARLKPGRIVVLGSSATVSDGVVSALRSYTSGGVTRLAGRDRYATAAAVSASLFTTGVPVAYVTTGENFPDALGAGAVAARRKGPVLLTTGTALPSATAAELRRLAPQSIVVVGGSNVVSDGVLAALRGYTAGAVTRVAGSDRYETAADLSAGVFSADAPSTVYLATGRLFPDGLAGTPAAVLMGGPVLLVDSSTLPAATANELRRLNPSLVVVLGSSSSISSGVVSAIARLWD